MVHCTPIFLWWENNLCINTYLDFILQYCTMACHKNDANHFYKYVLSYSCGLVVVMHPYYVKLFVIKFTSFIFTFLNKSRMNEFYFLIVSNVHLEVFD